MCNSLHSCGAKLPSSEQELGSSYPLREVRWHGSQVPDLVELQKKYQDRLQVVGLVVDDTDEDAVRKFARRYAINYPVVMATDEMRIQYMRLNSIERLIRHGPPAGTSRMHCRERRFAKTSCGPYVRSSASGLVRLRRKSHGKSPRREK
jgi:hypothetical protein